MREAERERKEDSERQEESRAKEEEPVCEEVGSPPGSKLLDEHEETTSSSPIESKLLDLTSTPMVRAA